MLKKISKILLIISGVIGIVSAASLLTLGIVFIVLGTSEAFKSVLASAIENGTITVNAPAHLTDSEKAGFCQNAFLILSLVLFIITLFTALSVLFSFLSAYKGTTALLIINIIFGVLSDNILTIAGSVCGIVKIKDIEDEKLS